MAFPDVSQSTLQEEGQENVPRIVYRAQPDWELTTVSVDDLRKWLSDRGVKDGFFFPSSANDPDYIDRKNPRYAPRLAAAVRAWQQVTDPKGKSPKQALIKWLTLHAADFGLTDEQGNPNNTAIEDVAKVANWQTKGGAPRSLRG